MSRRMTLPKKMELRQLNKMRKKPQEVLTTRLR